MSEGKKTVRTMKPGQIAKGNISTTEGHFLRTYSNVVLLDNPGKTWDLNAPMDGLKTLPKGTELTLIAE